MTKGARQRRFATLPLPRRLRRLDCSQACAVALCLNRSGQDADAKKRRTLLLCKEGPAWKKTGRQNLKSHAATRAHTVFESTGLRSEPQPNAAVQARSSSLPGAHGRPRHRPSFFRIFSERALRISRRFGIRARQAAGSRREALHMRPGRRTRIRGRGLIRRVCAQSVASVSRLGVSARARPRPSGS